MNITSKLYKLPILVMVNGIVMLTSTVLSPTPRMIGPVSLILGMVTFYFIYSIPHKHPIYLDFLLFLTTLIGSGFSLILLAITCKFISKPVCTSNSFGAQVFGFFVFPLIIVLMLWVTLRLPNLLRSIKRK